MLGRSAENQGRMVQLDLLRGIAILLVIGRHPLMKAQEAGVLEPLAGWWLRFGWTGVDLFFVLSGFLIGGLLFQEIRARSQLDVRRFLIRRGFKIWPSYLLYITFFFVMLLIRGDGFANVARKVLPNYLHIQNYIGTPRHTWSLAIEEHFYLALPLALLFALRRRKGEITVLPLVPILAGVLIVVCTALRWIANQQGEYRYWLALYPTHCRIDSLFFGVLLAYLHHFKADFLTALAQRRLLLLLLGVALISPMGFLRIDAQPFVTTIGLVMLYVGYGCILLALVYTPVSEKGPGRVFRSLPVRAVASVGFFSYSIYLWHLDVGRVPASWLLHHVLLPHLSPALAWLLGMTFYALTAYLIGRVMAALIEQPALALRNRLFPAHAQTTAVVAAPREEKIEEVEARPLAKVPSAQ